MNFSTLATNHAKQTLWQVSVLVKSFSLSAIYYARRRKTAQDGTLSQCVCVSRVGRIDMCVESLCTSRRTTIRKLTARSKQVAFSRDRNGTVQWILSCARKARPDEKDFELENLQRLPVATLPQLSHHACILQSLKKNSEIGLTASTSSHSIVCGDKIDRASWNFTRKNSKRNRPDCQ